MVRASACLALALAFAAPAFAHHGVGTFELSKSVTFAGTLTKIEFINPHSWLYFEVKEADGKVSKHRCEMRSAHVLRRSGWTKELFPVGQQITVEAAPDRLDPGLVLPEYDPLRQRQPHGPLRAVRARARGRRSRRSAASCRRRSSRGSRGGRAASPTSAATGRRSRW